MRAGYPVAKKLRKLTKKIKGSVSWEVISNQVLLALYNQSINQSNNQSIQKTNKQIQQNLKRNWFKSPTVFSFLVYFYHKNKGQEYWNTKKQINVVRKPKNKQRKKQNQQQNLKRNCSNHLRFFSEETQKQTMRLINIGLLQSIKV